MAHRYSNHPIIAELDSIAQELDTTGNPDLATLVDEVSVELVQAGKRQAASAKAKAKAKAEKPKAEKPKARSKKNKKPTAKEASTNHSSRRARIASAMKRIAKAQVVELEDIAAELLKEGSKKTALEVLKIAEDLDSEYDYSSESHDSSESKGDASKRFDRTKANKPKAKMDADEKEALELPFGHKGEGYPLKQSAFDKEMEALLRLAAEDEAEEDMDMDLGDEESDEESDEDADDMDLEGLDLDEEGEEPGDEGDEGEELDFEGLDLGEGDDELAAMMEAMDHEASDRMYEADEAGDEDDMDMEMDMSMETEEGDEEDSEEGEEELEVEDEMTMDEDEDKEGLLGFEVGVDTPVGGLHLGQAQRKQMLALAKKLAAKGEKKTAAKIARLAKK